MSQDIPLSDPLVEEFRFETALEKLQGFVKKLESGELSLEECLKVYEMGVRLTQQSYQYLRSAEQKIEILNQDLMPPPATQ